jgi:hypothetical protein
VTTRGVKEISRTQNGKGYHNKLELMLS